MTIHTCWYNEAKVSFIRVSMYSQYFFLQLLLARGSMVELLSSSTVSKYLEFRAAGAILQCIDGKLGQVGGNCNILIVHIMCLAMFRYLVLELICLGRNQFLYWTRER